MSKRSSISLLFLGLGAVLAGGMVIGINLEYVMPEANPHIVSIGIGLAVILMGFIGIIILHLQSKE